MSDIYSAKDPQGKLLTYLQGNTEYDVRWQLQRNTTYEWGYLKKQGWQIVKCRLVPYGESENTTAALMIGAVFFAIILIAWMFKCR